MILFVDLHDEVPGGSFAFFNTVIDMFECIGNEQVWDTEEEFIEAYKYDTHDEKKPLERYLKLIPEKFKI